MLTDREREEMALFRYNIISPLIISPERYLNVKAFFREAAEKVYEDPNGKDTKISSSTIERWYYRYKKYGFDSLKPQIRADAGSYRKIDEDIEEQVRYIKQTYPRLPAVTIYDKLQENGTISKNDVSLSTITRLVSRIKKEEMITSNKDMRRYEKAHINEVWCGDSSYGAYLITGNTKVRTYIIALMDDASRMVLAGDIFTRDNYINLMAVIKVAVHKYGVPKMFNFDNGKNYRSHQMELLAGRIGSNVHYNPPYTPTGKAKIERWFKTLKDHWLCQLTSEELHSLDLMRESFQKYVDEYNNTVHSSLQGYTPKQRFFLEGNRISRITDQQIHDAFLLELERKVSSDSVVMIDSVEYEVHYSFAKQRIKLRYSPDLSEVYVVKGDKLEPVKLLNKVENSSVKREKVKFYEQGE